MTKMLLFMGKTRALILMGKGEASIKVYIVYAFSL